jgi:type I restriction enzyme S subunit
VGEWEKYKISNLLEFFTTNSLSWEQLEYGTENLYNLHYGLIHSGVPTQMDLDSCILPNIRKEFTPNNYILCKNGDIAFADASEDTNDVAKVVEFLNCGNKNAICGLHTIHGRDKLHLTIKGFKGYAFSSIAFRYQIRRLAQGTKIYSIGQKNFSESYICIPSKEEQTKIARLMFLIDERITTQIKIIEKLESLIKALRVILFSNEKQQVPKLRFPEFAGEWVKYKLSDICTFYSGGTPTSSNKRYYGGEIPFIRSGEINSDRTELFLSEEGLNSSSAKIINKGDLVIALYGATSGEIAISKIDGAINQAILCVNTTHNKIFLKCLWKNHVDKILLSYLQGGQGNLSTEIIKCLKFYFPKETEQTKIADFLSIIDEKIETEKKILTKYAEQKKYLLRNLFI